MRALKQNASAVVAEAAAGEVVTITDRGRPVAQLVPLAGGTLANLVTAGRARPARARLGDLGEPPRRRPGAKSLSSVLRQQRDDERY